jgi:magnesium transporter
MFCLQSELYFFHNKHQYHFILRPSPVLQKVENCVIVRKTQIQIMHKKSLETLKELPLNERGFKLLSLSPKTQSNILKDLSVNEIIEIIEFLDPGKATKIISKLSKLKMARVLKKLKQNVQDKIGLLLKFDPDKSGAILNFNYIEIDKQDTVKEIIKRISKYESTTGKLPTVLVLEKGYLLGEVSLNRLIVSRKNCVAHKLVSQIPRISCNENEEKVLAILRRKPHGKIAVLNENNSIFGIIHAEDILHLIDKQASKSLRKFAGINKNESICDNALSKVKYRYGWLIVNLGTAFMAAAVVGLFENTITRIVALAAFLPIVAGMGGNAATQTLAVTVRALSLDEINNDNFKKILKQESIAGIINGAITGSIAAVIAILLGQTPLLGAVLFIAMILNLFVAGFFGAVIPLFMKKMGKDPASSATIFITTATDVFGFLAFLGLATLIL